MFLMGMAILTTSFEEGMLRNKALGLNGALPSLGFAVDAVLGGFLTDLFGWPFSSLMSFPFGLVVLGIARFMIKNVAKRINQKLDVPGAATLTIDLLALVLGVAAIERDGWGSTTILGLLIVAAIVSWSIEARSPHPLAAVTILKRPTVSLGTPRRPRHLPNRERESLPAHHRAATRP
jgi:asparagine N-glycosylation enzyme membrane subunit Stt3